MTAIEYTWGGWGDIPIPADYDGDSKTDIGVFRRLHRQVVHLAVGHDDRHRDTWGGWGDIPIPADYDGDSKTDIGVFDPPPASGTSGGRAR